MDHMFFEVVSEYQVFYGRKSVSDSGGLGDYVNTIFIRENHFLETSDLPLNAFQAVKRLFFGYFSHILYYTPRGYIKSSESSKWCGQDSPYTVILQNYGIRN